MATATLTAKETIQVLDDAGNLVSSVARNVTGDAASKVRDQFPGGSANVLVAFPLVKARTQMFVFTSDQPAVIKTNSTSAPQEIITLAAGGSYSWNALNPEANPIIGDISALYVSVAGTSPANVTVYALTNATP